MKQIYFRSDIAIAGKDSKDIVENYKTAAKVNVKLIFQN